MASWVHPNRTKSRDGIPGYAFGFGDPMPLAGPFVIRTFDTGKGQAAKDRQIAEGSPFLAVQKETPWPTGLTLSKRSLGFCFAPVRRASGRRSSINP